MPSATPRIDPSLAALLGRVWPRLPGAAARAEAMGFAWTAVSTPFVRREGERVVGHVGVIELPQCCFIRAARRRASLAPVRLAKQQIPAQVGESRRLFGRDIADRVQLRALA